MNKEFFSIPGLEVHEIMNSKSGEPGLLFKSTKGYFSTVLEWESFELNSEQFWSRIAPKINSLLFNRVKFEDKVYTSEEELEAFIESNYPQNSPKEKLNDVLEFVYSLQTYDGEPRNLSILGDIITPEVWRRYYFANESEFLFYLENLKSQGLVEYEPTEDSFLSLKLTLTGLTEILKIKEAKSSLFCFVAMSFDPALEEVYNQGILPAIIETGFKPYIVRTVHVETEKTINDAIIAGIKKSRFTIADFTQHKSGVYFEAGYALGRGQKVIYTCRRDEIDKAHFDTRNYQHIVWDDPEDLRKKLIDKITAYVLD